MIQSVNSISQNRCSLSDEDLLILNEALSRLQELKKKKGRTNEEVLQIAVTVVELISKVFKE